MPSDLQEIKCLVSSHMSSSTFHFLINSSIGMYEFVKKGDPPVVGITKLDGVTLEELKRPRRKIPLDSTPAETTAETFPSVSTSTSTQA